MEYLYQEAKHVRRQKCPKRKVTGLTREAVTAMLETPDTTTAIGRRDLVFLTVLYATAARMDEVLSIKIGHLHLDAAKPHVNLYGKGEKLRTSYLLPRAVSLLRQYIKEVHGSSPDKERLPRLLQQTASTVFQSIYPSLKASIYMAESPFRLLP